MRFTIKARLAASFLVLLVLMGISASTAVTNLAALHAQLDGIVTNGPVDRQTLALEISNNLSLLVRQEKNMILEDNDDKIRQAGEGIKKTRADLQQKVAQLREIATVEDRKNLDEIGTMIGELYKVQDELMQLALANTGVRATEILYGRGDQAHDTTLDILKVIDAGANPEATSLLVRIAMAMEQAQFNGAAIVTETDETKLAKLGQDDEALLRDLGGNIASGNVLDIFGGHVQRSDHRIQSIVDPLYDPAKISLMLTGVGASRQMPFHSRLG